MCASSWARTHLRWTRSSRSSMTIPGTSCRYQPSARGSRVMARAGCVRAARSSQGQYACSPALATGHLPPGRTQHGSNRLDRLGRSGTELRNEIRIHVRSDRNGFASAVGAVEVGWRSSVPDLSDRAGRPADRALDLALSAELRQAKPVQEVADGSRIDTCLRDQPRWVTPLLRQPGRHRVRGTSLTLRLRHRLPQFLAKQAIFPETLGNIRH